MGNVRPFGVETLCSMIIEDFFVKISKKIIRELDDTDHSKQGFWFSYQQPGFVISITTRCNFNCPHCLRATIDKDKTFVKDLSLSVLETILKEGKKMNFRYISITGGEPVLHPRFKDIISLIGNYGYKFYLGSNGWFYKEYWESIEQNRRNFKFMFLSLDGVTPEIHDAVRGRSGSFGKIMEAVKFYGERKVPTIATFCVTPGNYHQIERFPDFCLKNGIKLIKWVTVIPRGCEPGKPVSDSSGYILTDVQRREALGKILRLREEFRGQCLFTITTSFFSISGITESDAYYINRGLDFCSALNGYNFFIDHDGAVLFCCDLNREIKNKPLIQDLGFEEALKVAVDTANEIKKRYLDDLLNNPRKINRICDFCNDNIDFCSQLAAERNHRQK